MPLLVISRQNADSESTDSARIFTFSSKSSSSLQYVYISSDSSFQAYDLFTASCLMRELNFSSIPFLWIVISGASDMKEKRICLQGSSELASSDQYVWPQTGQKNVGNSPSHSSFITGIPFFMVHSFLVVKKE